MSLTHASTPSPSLTVPATDGAADPSSESDAGAGPRPFSGRRQLIVTAARAVVARSGLRGLTHRAVDAEAGLPLGSASSYFRTRVALLTALSHDVGHDLTVQVLELAQRVKVLDAAPGDERLALITEDVVGLFGRLLHEPDLVLVQAELSLEAQRQPALQEVLRPWRDGLVAIVARIARDAGKPEPAERAITLVAAMEGVVLAGLDQRPGERTAYLRNATGMLLGGLYD